MLIYLSVRKYIQKPEKSPKKGEKMATWLIIVLIVVCLAALVVGIIGALSARNKAVFIIVGILGLLGLGILGYLIVKPLIMPSVSAIEKTAIEEKSITEKAGPTTVPGNSPDGPIYWESETGFNVWGAGEKVDWSKVKEPTTAKQYLVAHGDLLADGVSRIAVFTSIADARAYLGDGTWKINFVDVSNPDGTIKEYVIALNLRLGGDYLISSELLDE